MKKIFLIVAIVIGFEFSFFNFAYAELIHFSTDKNDCKTYFDTESIRVSAKNSNTATPPGDVWIKSDSSGDWYVQTHRISENLDSKEFVVPLKLVVNGRLGNNRPQLFKYSGGIWYAKYRDSSMDFEPINSNEIYRKIFDACKPYCKLAQTYPR